MAPPFRSSQSSADPIRRPPPTNYRSRAVQLRLFTLLAGLLLVLMLIGRAKDPKFWTFLGFQDRPIAGGTALTDQEIAKEDVETRLPPSIPEESQLGVIGDSPKRSSAKTELDPTEPPERWGAAQSDAPAELAAASRDAWRQVLESLTGDEQLLWYDALDSLARGRRLAEADRDAWTTLLDKCELEWRAYAIQAVDSLSTLPEDQQTLWRLRLGTLHGRWHEYWRPLLDQWVGGESAPEVDPLLIERLQQMLDAITLDSIRDNTMSRTAEKAVWFRWLARLRDTTDDDLRQQSMGPTGYLSLFKQPRDYRGKVVTIRGVVHLAYHVPAPPNRPGIPGYYLFWVRPAGGPNSPIVVYSLDLPQGFPPIKDKYADGELTTLNEEVEFTGYFFKRWAYPTEHDIQVAPLLLARAPRWQAPVVSSVDEPSWPTLLGLVAISAVLGIGIALVALKRDPLSAGARRAVEKRGMTNSTRENSSEDSAEGPPAA
jgi:hypothetical protein